MAAAASSGGRDVIFRLRTMIDPKDLESINLVGKRVQEIQEQIAKTGAAVTKKAIDDANKAAVAVIEARQKTAKTVAAEEERERNRYIAAQLKQDRLVASSYLREHLAAIQQKAKQAEAERKRTLADQLKHDKLVAGNYLREHLRAIKEREREQINSHKRMVADANRAAREMAAAQRKAQLAGKASVAGFSRAGAGAMGLARGAALAGLVGEEDSKKLLDSLLMIEASFQSLHAGIDIFKGLSDGVSKYRQQVELLEKAQKEAGGVSAASSGVGAAGSAAGMVPAAGSVAGAAGATGLVGVAGTVAAALAAVAASAWAAVTVFETARDISRHGLGGGSSGGVSGYVGEKQAEAGVSIMRKLPAWMRGGVLGSDPLTSQFIQTANSEDRIAAQQTAAERRREAEAGGASSTANFYAFRRKELLAAGNTDALKAQLAEIQAKRSASQGRTAGSAGALPAEEMATAQALLQIHEKIRDEALRTAKERVQGAKDELANVREIARERIHEAERSSDAIKSNFQEFAKLKEAERKTLGAIKLKMGRGEALTGDEAALAGRFGGAFADYAAKSENARAKTFGADSIFSADIAKSEADKAAAAEAKEKVSKAEIELKGSAELLVKITKGEDLTAAQIRQVEEFKKIIKDYNHAMGDKFEEEMKAWVRQEIEASRTKTIPRR